MNRPSEKKLHETEAPGVTRKRPRAAVEDPRTARQASGRARVPAETSPRTSENTRRSSGEVSGAGGVWQEAGGVWERTGGVWEGAGGVWEGFRNTRRTARGTARGTARSGHWRVNTDPETVERDLTRLVLTLVELIRQLVERQCVRRMDRGDLSDEQVEVLGLTLMRLEEAMTELCERFGLSPSDLNLDLGPLGTLLPTD
ncbi:hypothetical protein GCM10009525_74920 [Streptosporangium amethystogenes subsp. fukuiense]